MYKDPLPFELYLVHLCTIIVHCTINTLQICKHSNFSAQIPISICWTIILIFYSIWCGRLWRLMQDESEKFSITIQCNIQFVVCCLQLNFELRKIMSHIFRCVSSVYESLMIAIENGIVYFPNTVPPPTTKSMHIMHYDGYRIKFIQN